MSDVIGGWGAESERALRKVAQRGGTFLLHSAFAPLSIQPDSIENAF